METNRPKRPQALAQRARMVLACAGGESNGAVARARFGRQAESPYLLSFPETAQEPAESLAVFAWGDQRGLLVAFARSEERRVGKECRL